MTRIILAGPELAGFGPCAPAASVRMLLGSDSTKVVLPIWNRNEFLLADGSRAVIRTLTPLRFDPTAPSLTVEVVKHGTGPLSRWADTAMIGDYVAVSGPGRGYEIATTARSFLVGGDDAAVPAICTLLEAIPHRADIDVLIEARHADARVGLPVHPRATIRWLDQEEGSRPGDALFAALETSQLNPDVRVWVAGEAAAVQRIRRHLFDDRALERAQAVIRGYWKHQRSAGATHETVL